jgi:hypothetical protein
MIALGKRGERGTSLYLFGSRGMIAKSPEYQRGTDGSSIELGRSTR